MAEYFMGQRIELPELPINAPRPRQTGPEGVFVTDAYSDGTVRKYIYKALAGRAPQELLISETQGVPDKIGSGRAVPVDSEPDQGNVVSAEEFARMMGAEDVSGIPAGMNIHIPGPRRDPVAPQTPIQTLGAAAAPMPVGSPGASVVPVSERPVMMGEARLVSAPQVLDREGGFGTMRMPSGPVPAQGAPMDQGFSLGQAQVQMAPAPQGPILGRNDASMGGPTSFLKNQVPVRMGQAQPTGPVAAGMQTQVAPAPNVPPEPMYRKCPGPVELPDGKVLEPGDYVSLDALCQMMPYLLEAYAKVESGLAPGQKVPVVGQSPDGRVAVPTPGSMGPGGANNPYGRGGGGFIASGGGGPGPRGPAGTRGPAGPGSVVEDPIEKTDGDFSAGPGAFVAVPGTLLGFSMSEAGKATFLLEATLGDTAGVAGSSQNGQIGLRIDGTDHVVATRLIDLADEYLIGQSSAFVIQLPAGDHTVEVVLRGIGPGEFGGGLGIPVTVAASPDVPLRLAVSHS